MKLEHNLFVHGHSAEIENPADMVSMDKRVTTSGLRAGPPLKTGCILPCPLLPLWMSTVYDPARCGFDTRPAAAPASAPSMRGTVKNRIAAIESPVGEVEDGWTTVKVGLDSQETLAVYWGHRPFYWGCASEPAADARSS